MCEQQVMRRGVSRLLIAYAWSMFAIPISKIGRAPGLVQRDPPVDSISQLSRDYLCVVGKSRCRIPVEPATFLVQRQRQVPMIQSYQGSNTACQECIH